MNPPSSLREARQALLDDASLQGAAFGRALADLLDDTLRELSAGIVPDSGLAIVALGSYGRRELCPGSDVDVLILHGARRAKALAAVRETSEKLWYPLWDAGLVTGHGTRTVKESIALADDDLNALTAILDVRHIVGDVAMTEYLVREGRVLARKRRARVLRALADGSELRRLRPGPVAEVLEPDLKEGAGGLRDAQSLEWAGWLYDDETERGGIDALVARGYLSTDDVARVRSGVETLLTLRIALQRLTNSHSDRLALQEQDAVARALGIDDADVLVRDLATGAREIAWIAGQFWERMRGELDASARRAVPVDQPIAQGVTLRNGAVELDDDDQPVSTLRLLEAAVAAAELDVPFERTSLLRMRAMATPVWDVWERAAFLRLLRSGRRAVPVFEALDHAGVLVRILPEWEHVRSRPQRNAYHRFTIDRHLLEAVAECAELLDAGDASPLPDEYGANFDAKVARACRRPELLLLGALLHDIGKGRPGDHSEVGAVASADVARRIGLDSEGREILQWLVRNHLLMADLATRRDLSDASVADNLAASCAADGERLRLLYLLTIGDSHATGPAAWSSSKAALVRDLFIKAATAIERGQAAAVATDRREALATRLGRERAEAFLARMPESYVLAFDEHTMAAHADLLDDTRAVLCAKEQEHVSVTVVAPDRPGLLATLAGALTICGLDVSEANLFGTTDGIALDVFRATDPYGRIDKNADLVERTVLAALDDQIDVGARVEARGDAYRVASVDTSPAQVLVHLHESESDTLVEVHAADDIGLLYRLASAFADLGLDVRVAKVGTSGARVVDVFYVRDAHGNKVVDPETVAELRRTLLARLTPAEDA